MSGRAIPDQVQVCSNLFKVSLKVNQLIQMDLEAQDFLIQKCLSRIEELLGRGKSEDWSTQDFETLSQRIMDKTHVQLSVITLKRIWGRIRYESKPTVTTLNTLAQFIGFENWGAFKQHHIQQDAITAAPLVETKRTKRRSKYYALATVLGILLASSTLILYFSSFDLATPVIDPSKFQFTSKKIVDVGVPNSVIFNYDASAAKSGDSVFIQQSWDKRLSQQVDRLQQQHTSIYYYPGFFAAKLRINDQVVQEHKFLIKTNGWLPILEIKPVPLYLKSTDIVNEGSMQLPVEKIKEVNIPLQPDTPWTGYYNVGDFGEALSNDLVFETEIKNEYSKGTAACQHTEIHLLFEGGALVMPLSIPGCISELTFGDMSGKKLDLSPLGVNFSDWVNVKFHVQDTLVLVYINQKKAFELKASLKPVKLVGLVYRFKGTGSVNFVKISRHNGDFIYHEDFDGL